MKEVMNEEEEEQEEEQEQEEEGVENVVKAGSASGFSPSPEMTESVMWTNPPARST